MNKTTSRSVLPFLLALAFTLTSEAGVLFDTRFFANRLFDAFAILERTGDLTAEDLAGLKAWFAQYLDWMMTSPIGLDEQDEHNNHGTAYDLQAATFALM